MHQRQRNRSAASLGSDHQNPSRTARKPILPELPQRAEDRSRGAPHTPSGAGSVRSEHWKRTPKSLAHRAKADPPRASSASGGPVPRSAPYAKRSGIGLQRALEAITKSPRAPRESRSSQSFLSERRTGPAERPIRQAERDRSAASLGSEHQKPLAHRAKADPPRASSASEGSVPRSTHAQTLFPLARQRESPTRPHVPSQRNQ